MNHPKPEEWAEYVSGDLTARERGRLSEHLEECPECASKVASWQRTVARLQKWRMPKALPGGRRTGPMVKWAIAAALMFGIGIALGRIGMPPRESSDELRTQVIREVERAIAAAEARLQEQLQADARLLWRTTAEAMRAGRNEDRRAVLALLDRQVEEQDRKWVSLRQELETLASVADQELREAQLKILQFASTKNDQP
jgi:anti-sigma factor RsiW